MALEVFAQDAPVTQAAEVIDPGPLATVTISVINFNDIGAISLTLQYDASVALATTVEPNPGLSGEFLYNTTTSGIIIISWMSLSGITLTDGSVLFTITFLKVSSGSTSLNWYDDGISCEYAKFDGGEYTVLNDSPASAFYLPGELGFQAFAPQTTISDQIACANDIVLFPVTVNSFNNIGVISLTVNYDPDVLDYQGFTPHPGLPDNFTVQAVVDGTAIASGYLEEGELPVSLDDGSVLFIMNFLYHGGHSDLTWYDDGTSCEYASGPPDFIPCYDEPQSSYYFDGSISEHSRPTVVVSGTATINKGQSTDITFTLTGTPPWNLTYTDGTTPVTETGIASTPYIVSVSPLSTRTYTATALSDAVCAALPGNISGEAVITVNEYPLDIILQKNTNCGEFTVKLKPQEAVNQNLTKIIFTISWPAVDGSDVQIEEVSVQWPGLAQQGSRVLFEGNYYVTFSSTTIYPVDWAADSENTIMTFSISATGDGTADFIIIADDYDTGEPGLNTGYYVEVANYEATNAIDNTGATGASLNCGLYVKDFLQGAYNTTTHLMRTDLKDAGFLPVAQPYATTPLAYNGGESVVSFTTSVVDWVVIELRIGTAPETKVVRQAALLLANGNIVSTDQLNPPVFHEIIPGNSYYVVIYHRNHLRVMTSGAIPLPNTSGTRHDFTTNPPVNVYGSTNGVILLETGVYGQIAGDINMDNKLIYSGKNNDKALIIAKISAIYTPPPPATLTSFITGYYSEDLNMNSVVKYSGPGNDQGIIIANIGKFIVPTFLTSIYQGVVP